MAELIAPLAALAAGLAFVGLGGALYEHLVLDRVWPSRPDIIQPARGGVSRRRFWVPTHVAYELVTIGLLLSAWSVPAVRLWASIAFGSHAMIRAWSAFDFIPKALAFERLPAGVTVRHAAQVWTRRSLLRLPLQLLTCGTTLAGFAVACRLP